MAGRAGTVATPQQAGQNYQQRVQQAGQRWQQGVQATQLNPMEMAAAQQAKCAANFAARINDNGPGGWASRLRATPVSYWKSQCGATAVQKYQMAKGAVKWQNWYTATGHGMAQEMRALAANERQQGVPWQQRVINALDIAVAAKGR